jgi:hypothetical protein
MTDSARRALRTGWQVLVTAMIALPFLLQALGAFEATFPQIAGLSAALASAAAAVSRGLNALEDAGMIPAWLTGGRKIPAPKTED